MMSKLTAWMRDAVVANAVEKAGINKAFEDYRKERKDWACAVADESLGGADVVAKLSAANKKIAAIIKTLPESLQSDMQAGPLVGSIIVSFGGMRTSVNEWDDLRPAKNGHTLAADHPLTVQFEKLERTKKELWRKRSDLRSEVRAAVDSVTTIKRLLAVWPEAKELLPNSAMPQAKNLPAIQVGKLNEAIGLPSEVTE